MGLPWLMKVAYSTGSVCPAASRHKDRNRTTQRANISEHLQDNHREGVILRGSCGEPVRAFDQCSDGVLGGAMVILSGGRDQTIFSPFLVVQCHGLADPVGEGDESVVGIQLQTALVIVNFGQDADYRAADFQALHSAGRFRVAETIHPRSSRTQEYGSVVARIYVIKGAGRGIVFAKEEGDETVAGRGIVDDPVEAFDEPGETDGAAESKPVQGRTDRSHQKGGGDALSGDIADGDAQAAVLKLDEVVVVAANLLGGAAKTGKVQTFDHGIDLGQEPLLHLAGNLDFTIDALALYRLLCEVVHQGVVFNGQPGLQRHRGK